MRFSELADWYFENYAPVELKESTVYNYKTQYENHLAPKIGNMKLKDITTPKITELMQSYTLNPTSKNFRIRHNLSGWCTNCTLRALLRYFYHRHN